MFARNVTVLVVGLAAVVACSPTSKQAKEELALPVNCGTAAGDIRVLESEKAHAGQQLLAGVTAIMPAGAVIGLATGTEGEKAEVATGDYNRRIDEKIAEIKRTCGL